MKKPVAKSDAAASGLGRPEPLHIQVRRLGAELRSTVQEIAAHAALASEAVEKARIARDLHVQALRASEDVPSSWELKHSLEKRLCELLGIADIPHNGLDIVLTLAREKVQKDSTCCLLIKNYETAETASSEALETRLVAQRAAEEAHNVARTATMKYTELVKKIPDLRSRLVQNLPTAILLHLAEESARRFEAGEWQPEEFVLAQDLPQFPNFSDKYEAEIERKRNW